MQPLRKQLGAALVVSLVILAVVTLIGVAAMQNSSLELKLVASTKDRTTAFQAAEAALDLYERQFELNPPSLNQLSSGCIGDDRCFVNCTDAASVKKGFCFQGTYVNGQGKANCSLAGAQPFDPVAAIKANNYDQSSPAAESVNAQVNDRDLGIQNTPVKILAEFLCFVEKPSNLGGTRIRSDAEENSSYISLDFTNSQLVPLFRLTAIADGDAKRSHVVVQTTVRLDQ
jgi:type IV pilus assembly protein PilX